MSQCVFLAKVSDFTAEDRAVFNVAGKAVLVIKTGQGFYAIANQCPHLGLPLASGKVEGDTITCPWEQI